MGRQGTGGGSGVVCRPRRTLMRESVVVDDLDALVPAAVERCGNLVVGAPGRTFQEAYLETALVKAARALAPECRATARLAMPVPHWKPPPGPVDLVLDLAVRRAVLELKVWDVGHTLWDLLKVACTLDLPDVSRAYLVVAARPRDWRGDCGAIFDPGSAVWPTRDLLARWPRSWERLLRGGRARPRRVPARLRVERVASCDVPAFPDHEIRCVEVRPARDPWLALEDGWPAPS